MSLVIIVNRLPLFIWGDEFMSCVDENLIRSFIENPGQFLLARQDWDQFISNAHIAD